MAQMLVVEIGEKSEQSGNCTVKMQSLLDTPVGKVVDSTFYLRVKSETCTATVGQSIENFPLDKFDVEEREFAIPSGDNAGEVIKLKWLRLKRA